MMRSISYVDRLELEFSGNHFSDAVVLGDVDSDGINELVIGNVDGVLAIFKGTTAVHGPVKKCSGLGPIVCVGIGDLLNIGKNILVCINTEGMCRLFDINPSPALSRATGESPDTRPKSSRTMKPLHSQVIDSGNVKTVVIAKLRGKDECDMVLGHTDRCVSVYHWTSKQLSLLHKVNLPGQIGSVRVSSGLLLVSQPGGTYQPLGYKQKDDGSYEMVLGSLVGQPVRRNPTSFTQMVGALANGSDSDITALCTLDGTLRMLKGSVKQWELQVDYSLFAIEKLDLTGNGCDEIVACAWDGMTYIVDQSRNIVRFRFEQSVSSFTAGHYGDTGPCLVYTTFSNHIYVYYNITLPSIPASNLFTAFNSQIVSLPGFAQDKLQALDDEAKQSLFKDILYNFKNY